MHSEHPIPIDDYTSACSDKPSKARKVALADVLLDAANLVDDISGYSCFSVDCAASAHGLKSGPRTEYDRFLKKLGCDTGTVMSWFPTGHERQGVRYMWLLLAAHVAEDEGIQIEVPA
jgi:hypothetical protein